MKQKSISLDEIKIAVVKSIIDDKVSEGDITTQEQYNTEYNELLSRVTSKDIISVINKQDGLTNSDNFNQSIIDLYIDLLTSFGYMNSMDQAVTRHKKINESVINTLKTNIAKLNDDISNFEQIIKEQFNSDNYTEGFRDVRCFSDDPDLYIDRDGTLMSLAYKSVLDVYNENITLPHITHNNTLLHSNGVALARTSLPMQLGNGLITIKNSHNDLSKAVDTSMDTYWAECILCDTPMRVELDDYYYNTDFGAVCEIEIKLQSATTINEITLMPYGSYPLDIIAIRYFETDELTEEPKEILYPTNSDDLLGYKMLSSPIAIKFEDRLCKRVRILINQIHYIKNNFIVSAEDKSKNELWFNSSAPVEVDLDDELFKPLYSDQAILDKAFALFNKTNKDISKLNIESLMNKEVSNTPISKYQYTYGFYNIGVHYNDFQDTGIFVSNMIRARSNIKSLVLDVDEIYPITTNGHKHYCDIEYYVSYVSEPTKSDWYPIVPINKSSITNELLMDYYINNITSVTYYTLRFPANGAVMVKANGIELSSDYYITATNSDGKINAVAILPNAKPNIKYTVDYTPIESSKMISLIDSNMTPTVSIDSIEGTGLNYYELSNIPYISSNMISNVQIILESGAVISQLKGDIFNITNIYSPKDSYKSFDNTKIQYYIDGNRIYFNRDIGLKESFKIEYSHYITGVRVKAILRRNTFGHNWMTPILDNLRLKFNVID